MRPRTFPRRFARPRAPARPVLLLRIHALRLRLRGRALLRQARGRTAARVPPLERVMRRLGGPQRFQFFTARFGLRIVHPAQVLQHVQHVQHVQHLQHVQHVQHMHAAPIRAARIPVQLRMQHVRVPVAQQVPHTRVREQIGLREGVPRTTQLSFVLRVEQPRAAPRLPLTMVRHAAAGTRPVETRPDVETDLPEQAARLSQPRFANAAPRQALPPEELSRVTEHVIRQLDHRALSWQERTGRA